MKRKPDKTATLDSKHNDMKKHFINKQKKLVPMKNKLKKMKNKLKSLTLLTEQYYLEKRICDLEKEISCTENKEDEWDYYINSSKLIYNYYDTIKKAKTNTFFPIENKKTINRANILDKYINVIDKTHLKYEKYDTEFYKCKNCNIEKNINLNEACMICETCGLVEPLFIDSENPNYKNPPLDATNIYSYKRINHLQEWLSKFQAKESIEIPDEIFNNIMIEIKKERITDLNKLTYKKIKGYLKKLKFSKYYDHVPYILYRINGKKPPRITKQLENNFKEMFKDIEETFIKVCPKKRKNFLSYPYVLHKLMELQGLHEYKECFKLLKSREKLHQQDLIWKKICEELNCQFIKSV